MLEVNQAEYAGDYKINLLFNNGKTGTANLEKSICNDKQPVFLKLKEPHRFKNFHVDHGDRKSVV